MPITISAASLTDSVNRKISPPTIVKLERSATETVVPTTCSISVVSEVRREAISDGRFSSKKRGDSVSRLACTAMRRSATTRSPIQATNQKRMAVASASVATIISR